jgi:hypothetical protein
MQTVSPSVSIIRKGVFCPLAGKAGCHFDCDPPVKACVSD